MTAQHFNEMLETFQQATGLSLVMIADLLGTSSQNLSNWKRNGVPVGKVATLNIGKKFGAYLSDKVAYERFRKTIVSGNGHTKHTLRAVN